MSKTIIVTNNGKVEKTFELSEYATDKLLELIEEFIETECEECIACGTVYHNEEEALQYGEDGDCCDCQSDENVAATMADIAWKERDID